MENQGTHERSDDAVGSTSRRTALKLGVSAGVGLVAWTGPTISSLGGTPAYAVGCSLAVELDLSGGCRNTDQASGADFGYHTLKSTGFPAGYALTNNIAEGTACNAMPATLRTPRLLFPAGITCTVTVEFDGPGQCSGTSYGTLDYGPASGGMLDFTLECFTPAFPSSTQYTIRANCATTGAPASCFV